MQKVQVFLRDDQKAALKQLATRTGRKQSDLIRSGVDLMLDTAQKNNEDWRAVTRKLAGLWSDYEGIETLQPELRKRAKARFASIYADK